jgi:hypothetical protein
MNCNTCVHKQKLDWAQNVSCMYYWEHRFDPSKDSALLAHPPSFYKSIGEQFPYDYNPVHLSGNCEHYQE